MYLPIVGSCHGVPEVEVAHHGVFAHVDDEANAICSGAVQGPEVGAAPIVEKVAAGVHQDRVGVAGRVTDL